MTPRPASRLVEVCCFFAFIHSIFDELFCHIALVSYQIYSENERNFYISTCPNPNPRGSLDNAIPLNKQPIPTLGHTLVVGALIALQIPEVCDRGLRDMLMAVQGSL